MKLLRVGQKGTEKPAILDKDGKIREISSHVKDLNPDFLNFKTISELRNIDLKPYTVQEQNPVVGLQKDQKYCLIPGFLSTEKSNLSGGNSNISCDEKISS